jgi:hypothetical protein
VPSPTAIFLSDGGAGGQFSQEGGTVTSDSGSFQSTYTAPHGVTSVTISATNNGGLTNPSPTVVPVTAASNYSMGAPKVGPAGRISTPITLVLTDPDVTGTVICTLSDVSAMGTWSGTNLLTGNQVALTQAEPVQTVYYTPADDLVAEGDAPVAVTLSVSNDRDLVDPPDVTYAVYDPTTYGEVAFLALYSQFAASGQAAALGITVYGKGNTTVVAHTTQYTEELGSTGDYVFVVPVPLLQSGAASMDPPSGQAQGYSQAYSAQGVSPVLAPADLTGIGATPIAALGAHALDSVQLIATDLTTFSIDEPLLLKWLRFVFYFLTNVTLSSGGTFTVKNSTGQTIVADLVATETSDQTVIGPGG